MSSLWAKIANGIDLATSKDIPDAGEFWIDTKTNNGKIGDGKTPMFELPWITLSVDVAKEEASLSIGTRAFIEDHIELIENNDYDTLYSLIATPALAQEVTRALLKAELNPKPYLTKIPSSIRHILEPYDVWIEDTSRLYTKSEMDAMLDEWNKKLFMQMGIPQNMIMVGN